MSKEMSEIHLNKESFNKKSEIHLLPCKISYNGEADVKSFFTSTIYQMENNPDAYETALRGRPINGIIYELSNDKLGVVLEKSNETTYEVTSSFDKLYSWQLDEPKVNENNDPFSTTFNDWIKVSEIIHE